MIDIMREFIHKKRREFYVSEDRTSDHFDCTVIVNNDCLQRIMAEDKSSQYFKSFPDYKGRAKYEFEGYELKVRRNQRILFNVEVK